VIVDKEGDVIYFCGRTGKYLERLWKTHLNIYAMAREGRELNLETLFIGHSEREIDFLQAGFQLKRMVCTSDQLHRKAAA